MRAFTFRNVYLQSSNIYVFLSLWSSEVLKVNLKIQLASKEYCRLLLKNKISSVLDYPNKERLDREDVSDKNVLGQECFFPQVETQPCKILKLWKTLKKTWIQFSRVWPTVLQTQT